MNIPFLLSLAGFGLLCAALFGLLLKKRGMNPLCALALFPLGAALGLVFSKVVYFLCFLPGQMRRYGLEGLLRGKASEFSFIGGCLGVVLALCLVCKLMKMPLMKTLDVFAPCGALMAALARAAEYLLDLVGLGASVQAEALQFFPVAVYSSRTGFWMFAIFMLEAAAAAAVALVGLCRLRRHAAAPGRMFFLTVFFLALPQVFCESLRAQCMKWGFVRIEQLFSGLICFFIVVYACAKCKNKKAWLPALCFIPCLFMLIGVEFLLDKPIFGTYLPNALCYLMMLLTLGVMAALALRAFRRRDSLSC